MRRGRVAVLLVAVALVIAGCSSTSAAPPTAAVSQAPTAAVGTTQMLSGGFTVQVKATKMISATSTVPSYFAAQSRVCMGSLATISRESWTARDAQGDTLAAEYGPTELSSDMAPYPADSSTPYAAGDCVQGWLFFRVPVGGGSKLSVRYAIGNGTATNPVEIRTWL